MLAAVITDIKDIGKAENADLIELRLDYIKNFNLNLIKKIKKPIILTCRKREEGGFFNGNEKDRIKILKNAIKYGADYADIEYSTDKKYIKDLIKNKNKAKIIVSYHNFKETPNNIKNIYNNIKKLDPDLIKIVTNANSINDNFKIFDLIKLANKENRKIIAFCMGSYGQFSRVLSIVLGSQITYASIDKGKETANGQMTISEMNNYRVKKINENTKILGLIGNPVEHSWSHIMHNAAFDKLNINAVYLKFRVDKLKEFIEYFRKLKIMGFSVTIPHKIEVMKYLDEIDKKAKNIGAVNTIIARNGKLIGYNTDCGGAIQALKEKTQLKNRNVIVLGAGGSARAIVYGLKEENANEITILNRTIEKAKTIANDFNCEYGSLDNLKNIDYAILINTTSVGMYPDVNSSPIPSNLIKNNSIVFDIVFNPFKTKLLKDAEKRNCTIIPGFEMLVYGNMLQFKLWTSKNAPEQLMRKKVMSYLKNVSN